MIMSIDNLNLDEMMNSLNQTTTQTATYVGSYDPYNGNSRPVIAGGTGGEGATGISGSASYTGYTYWVDWSDGPTTPHNETFKKHLIGKEPMPPKPEPEDMYSIFK